MKPGYESIEHTADKAIRAWGDDYAELLKQAALGTIAQIVDASEVSGSDNRTIRAEADGREILLHHLLKELLYLVEDDDLVPVDVVSVQSDGEEAVMEVFVVPLEAAKEHLLGLLKAVTYHDLAIEPHEYGLVTTVTFDT
jgi:SHS2 domain-containing protein